ncbi:MAG: hypothetical protein WCZ17_08940 [Candidatus Kapaibacterium sp.]|jgi:hypothetical protein
MNIAKISVNQAEQYVPREIKIDSLNHKSNATGTIETQKLTQWQVEILMQAITKLENNIHPDNSHPLSRKENQPIESKSELLRVMKELNFDALAQNGADAQANVSAEAFISLVMEN